MKRAILLAALLMLPLVPTPVGATEADERLAALLDQPEGYHTYDVDGTRHYAATLHLRQVPGQPALHQDLAERLESAGLAVAYPYRYIPAVGVIGPREAILAAAAMPDVEDVELAVVMAPALDVSARAIKARASTTYAGQDAGSTCGSGVVIAVLDTGVDDEHDGLYGKFVGGVDVSNTMPLALVPPLNEINPDDDNVAFGGVNVALDPQAFVEDPSGQDVPPRTSSALLTGISHGTHVAGAAMGTGGALGVHRGVAPCAKLVDVKILTAVGVGVTPNGVQNPFGTQAGIEWVLDYNSGKTSFGNPGADRVRVINLSIAPAGCAGGAEEKAIDDLVDAASLRFGIVVVAAAGNCGFAGIRSPGSADEAITVGATDDRGTVVRTDDRVALFSSRASVTQQLEDFRKPDVMAPGVTISSARGNVLARPATLLDPLGLGFLVRFVGDTETVVLGETGTVLPIAIARTNSYHPLSGTSMAAPHVAGLVALLLEADPTLSPRQVKQILHGTSSGGGAWSPEWGYGLVDAHAALGAGVSGEGNVPDVGIVEPTQGVHFPPSCAPRLKVFARHNAGSFGTLTLQVDAAAPVDISGSLDANGFYTASLSTAGTHTIIVRAQNDLGHWHNESLVTAACVGLAGVDTPLDAVGANDRFIAHLTPGSVAGVVTPNGRGLFVRYVPAQPDPAAVVAALSPPSATGVQDALVGRPVVVTVKLDGTMTARDPYDATRTVDMARLQLTGTSLVGEPSDGTWIVKAGQRRASAVLVAAGIQLSVGGKTFDHVSSSGACDVPGITPVPSEPIDGAGDGAAAGDMLSVFKLWNRHAQDGPRYDTSCSKTRSGLAGTQAPEESPRNARFFPQEV